MGHRKIEQVYYHDEHLEALCTDGTLWAYDGDARKGEWVPYPAIPGDDLAFHRAGPEESLPTPH